MCLERSLLHSGVGLLVRGSDPHVLAVTPESGFRQINRQMTARNRPIGRLPGVHPLSGDDDRTCLTRRS